MSHLNCEEAMRRLEFFLDHELTAEEEAEVRHHLEACPPCVRHFRFDEKLRRLVRVCAGPPAPPSLRARVESCLRGEVDPF
jgi:mycothiol system anti-sigma-R factor